MKRTTAVFTFCGLILAAGAMIFCQQSVSQAVIEAIKNCVFRIVPSLFGVTVLSTALSRSGAVYGVFRSERISPDILSAFILGNIGGYPIGARILSEAVSSGRLKREEAEEAMAFCYGAGPAFAAGIIGAAVFNSALYGIFALLCCILSNSVLFLIFIFRRSKKSEIPSVPMRGFSSALMVESIQSSVGAMSGVCSVIIFFTSVRAVLEAAFPYLKTIPLLSPVIEITGISFLSPSDGITLPIAAMFLSFGGLCVILQIFAIINGEFGLKKFLLSKMISVPLSGVFGIFAELILKRTGIASEASTKIRLSQSPSLIPVICVFAMVFITLVYPKRRS